MRSKGRIECWLLVASVTGWLDLCYFRHAMLLSGSVKKILKKDLCLVNYGNRLVFLSLPAPAK